MTTSFLANLDNAIRLDDRERLLVAAAAEAAAHLIAVGMISAPGAKVGAVIDSLTQRERQVLDAIVGGMSNKEAAHHLGCGIRTIETHRRKVMEKLGARNTAHLVNMFREAAARR